ncbi:MAG: hypothetical protein E3K36_12545 [Candidatus Brocadia sp.]|nr:hypothetical protein [Candidatus Brocadia sp.]
MKLLIDHDIYKITVDFLRQLGHEVVTAKELDLHTASDKMLLEKAKAMDRLFITNIRVMGKDRLQESKRKNWESNCPS